MCKKFIAIILILFCFPILSSCEKNASKVEPNAKVDGDAGSAILPLTFEISGGFVDGKNVECEFLVNENFELFESYGDIVYNNFGSNVKNKTGYMIIELTEKEKEELTNIVNRLDSNCYSKMLAILEQVPMIFMKLNNNMEGCYYYGEPENSAFSEIVAFAINRASRELKDVWGNEIIQRRYSNNDKNIEPFPKFHNSMICEG